MTNTHYPKGMEFTNKRGTKFKIVRILKDSPSGEHAYSAQKVGTRLRFHHTHSEIKQCLASAMTAPS